MITSGPAQRVLGLVVCLLLSARLLPAQSVSPPIAEYKERARSSFQLQNGSLFPITVVLEAKGFDITENGDVVDLPLDTSRVHLNLSAMSFQIPARGKYTVFYEARADSLPAWFNILSAMTGMRNENGLNVRILLPHVVYLNQKRSLRKTDVVVRRLEVDARSQRARVQLENTGLDLGRVLELSVGNAHGRSQRGGAFPLLPHRRRWVEVGWENSEDPDRVSLRFAGFSIDTSLTAAAALASDSAAAGRQP